MATEQMEYTEFDEGRRYVIPCTLRQIEDAGIRLNTEMGCDLTEHAELLDRANTVRIELEIGIEWPDHGPPQAYESADIQVYCGRFGQDAAQWESGLDILNPYRMGGERGLREANRQRVAYQRAAKKLAYDLSPRLSRIANVLGRRWEQLSFELWEPQDEVD